MDTKKRIVAAFDFDGTLTTRDTLPLFIIHARGWRRFVCGMLRQAPMLCRYLAGTIPNGEAKQQLFAYFFKGMPYKEFRLYGETFVGKIEKYQNRKVLNSFKWHKEQGHTVCIISASMKEWIAPWASKCGVDCVIATLPEVTEYGILTGHFLSPNCHGEEKVKRLLEVEPNRENYNLYAYGNSKGDIPLLKFADKGIIITNL